MSSGECWLQSPRSLPVHLPLSVEELVCETCVAALGTPAESGNGRIKILLLLLHVSEQQQRQDNGVMQALGCSAEPSSRVRNPAPNMWPLTGSGGGERESHSPRCQVLGDV